MIEGSESHGGESGGGLRPGGSGADLPGRRGEGDLLAERRARRVAESGEVILTRRAEAAEATVQTLERHVESLRQRLLEAEDDLRRTAELLEIEKTAALEREHELRRVKQREYAEQQLRVEAEERLTQFSAEGARLERESSAESERLEQRLRASEQEARALAERLEQLQRQLAEAEQAAGAERTAVRRAQEELGVRLSALESRAAQMQLDLEFERAARERSQAQLESMREGHGRVERLVGEMRGIVERLGGALAVSARMQLPGPPGPGAVTGSPRGHSPHAESGVESLAEPREALRGAGALPSGGSRSLELAGEARGAEMAEALAAAVERLRARAEAAPELAAAAESEAETELVAASEPAARTPHKHSMSLLGRWRLRRRQRRGR